MKNSQDSFLKGRLRSFRYAFRGVWILVRTEHSIIVQLGVALLMTFAGFWLNISSILYTALKDETFNIFSATKLFLFLMHAY